jgi:hypothetical protein
MTRVCGRWRSLLGSVALGIATSVAWLGGAGPAAEDVLSVDGRSHANPSIAAAGAFVAVTWVASAEGAGADVYAALSADAGRTFGRPVRVSGSAGADVSGEQPPRVVLAPRQGRTAAIVVVWTSKAPAGTRLLSARSDDGGRTFSSPSVVGGSDAAGNRGWQSVAMTPAGDAFAVWLDHRETVSTRSSSQGGAHQHAHSEEAAETTPPAADRPDGAIRAQLSKLFFGPVTGSGAARALASGVCYCCKTTIAAGPDGRFYAAWRHVYPGSIRDIAFTMSDDGGRTFAAPVRVSEDKWALNGCPENGPSLAVDARRRVHLVWPTLVPAAGPAGESALALFYAASSEGRRFTARQRIPSGPVARHPQIALGPRGDVFVVWDESAGGGRRQIGTARGTPDAGGAMSFTRQTIGDKVSATYPVAAVTDAGLLVAHVSRPTTGPPVIRLTRVSH